MQTAMRLPQRLSTGDNARGMQRLRSSTTEEQIPNAALSPKASAVYPSEKVLGPPLRRPPSFFLRSTFFDCDDDAFIRVSGRLLDLLHTLCADATDSPRPPLLNGPRPRTEVGHAARVENAEHGCTVVLQVASILTAPITNVLLTTNPTLLPLLLPLPLLLFCVTLWCRAIVTRCGFLHTLRYTAYRLCRKRVRYSTNSTML